MPCFLKICINGYGKFCDVASAEVTCPPQWERQACGDNMIDTSTKQGCPGPGTRHGLRSENNTSCLLTVVAHALLLLPPPVTILHMPDAPPDKTDPRDS